jgi:hypothetical protein
MHIPGKALRPGNKIEFSCQTRRSKRILAAIIISFDRRIAIHPFLALFLCALSLSCAAAGGPAATLLPPGGTVDTFDYPLYQVAPGDPELFATLLDTVVLPVS